MRNDPGSFPVPAGPAVTGGMTRRKFLRTGSYAAGLTAWPAMAQSRASAPNWRPRQALSSVMFSGLSLEAFCQQAAQLGFKGIDLWSPFGKCRHLAEAQQLGAAGWKKLLASHQLESGVWTTYRTKDHLGGFPEFAGFIGDCGGGVVVRESKYGNFPARQLEPALRKFFTELEPEIELARRHGVRLAIENHNSAILDSLDSIRLFTKLNPAPEWVGIALAPYHLQARKVSVEDAILACGKQLQFFYAWQLSEGVKQLPGHGPVDFMPWLRTLAKQAYGGWMTPFMHGELPAKEMAAAVSVARRCLDVTL